MKLHEEWLVKADKDLSSSKLLAHPDTFIGDTAAFHTQQCVEKSLKAYLAFHKKPIPKIHDCEELLELCIEINDDFKNFIDDVIMITPFATVFRYPGPVSEPVYQDVIQAIASAEKILSLERDAINRESSNRS